MAKINVAVPERFQNDISDALVEIFTGLINDINPELFSVKDYPEELPLSVRRSLADEAMRSANWSISTNGTTWTVRGPGVELSRVILQDQSLLYHKYFELSSKLQGNKIAAHVMRASLRITDSLKLTRIALDANLDIGGYAWLRKGAWPADGKWEIQQAVWQSRETVLGKEFLSFIENMSEPQLQQYVLSPDFRKYKQLFIGTAWSGNFDPNNIITRTAMINGADAAFESVVKTKPVSPKIPLTSNEKIANEFVKHHLRSMGFSKGLALQGQQMLDAGNEILESIITKYASKFTYPVDFTLPKNLKILKDFENDLIKFRSSIWDDVNELLTLNLKQYARSEAVYAAAVIEGAVPIAIGLGIPSPNKLARIATSKPFEGRTLAEWLTRTENFDVERITRIVKQGIVDGITPTQLVRNAIGTDALKGLDGVTKKAFRDMESVLLTATSQIQNDVRQELYNENADIFEEEYFVATLDIKTTHECAGHDGIIFKRGQGPMPPLHFRCRSLRAPYISAAVFRKRGFDSSTQKMLLDEFTEKNQIPAVGKRDELTRGFKTRFDAYAQKRGRELVGQVPATTNYNKWLKTQTPEFQNEYLGKAKAQAFREGRFQLGDFTSSSGRTYTVEELGIGG